MATDPRTFVDTDVLIDIARKDSRAVDFWRRAEARSTTGLLNWGRWNVAPGLLRRANVHERTDPENAKVVQLKRD